jgi:cobalt-precorrin-5B (C1)-methyltransferase
METPKTELRRGWTTGACATAAVKAALLRLWGGAFPETVTITLPRGEQPGFALAHRGEGPGWAEAGIVKDAGDDPDVTHGALIIARLREAGAGVTFRAGEGVGTVTKPGLPIPPGEPAINPVPRRMMLRAAWEAGLATGRITAPLRDDDTIADHWAAAGLPGLEITISIPGGDKLAAKTWNPRLGIEGGLSVLGTTGIVRPFSCAAWIASIHRGVDVARATGLSHVAGCTGATSERAVQALYGLPDHAMLDMGDFAGGMLKYLVRHPVARVTIGGGVAKLAKLAQGAIDLHSARSQVDFAQLAEMVGDARVTQANTVLEAYDILGETLAQRVAEAALAQVRARFGREIAFDVVVVDREGAVIARAGP